MKPLNKKPNDYFRNLEFSVSDFLDFMTKYGRAEDWIESHEKVCGMPIYTFDKTKITIQLAGTILE